MGAVDVLYYVLHSDSEISVTSGYIIIIII